MERPTKLATTATSLVTAKMLLAANLYVGGMEKLHASGDLRSGGDAEREHTHRCLAERRVIDNSIRSQFANAAVKEKSRLRVREKKKKYIYIYIYMETLFF